MRISTLVTWTGFAAAAFGCATMPADTDLDAKAAQVLKASFRAAGQAGLDRLEQDDTQRTCSAYAGKPPPKDVASRIEAQNLATIKYPADGKLVGDWKNGEKIAQEGRGKQFSDDPTGPVGANCYACHQLAPQELAYGTIGPTLYRFGRTRSRTSTSSARRVSTARWVASRTWRRW
jgi:L-cysteine S-thiosulfotransferase